MLVLTRRANEKILFPSLGITVEVVRVKGKTVRLGIDAPREIRAIRGELEIHPEPRSVPSSNEPCSDRDLQRKLDAANLAIHLARNQLSQGLTDYAEEALDQALTCLEDLEDSLGPHRKRTSKTTCVREARSAYKTSRPKVALMVAVPQPTQCYSASAVGSVNQIDYLINVT